MATAYLSNYSGVLSAMRRLDDKVQRKVRRKAMSRGTTVVARAIRSRVPVRHGILRKSIGKKTKIYRGSGVAVGIVGPRKGYRQPDPSRPGKFINPVNYAHLVNDGTKPHRISGRLSIGGQVRTVDSMHPGSRGVHFMENGFAASESEAMNVIIRTIKQELGL